VIAPRGYLLDTNVISETRRVRPDSGVLGFLSATDAAGFFLSVMTLGELRRGVESKRRSDPSGADQLAVWVEKIETTFADRVLPIDAAIARRWGEASAGRSIPVIDTLIAATALQHGLTLVTRNTGDFLATKVPVLDPWQDGMT
jgi:predicted nucleic acid-binding protein